MKIHEHQSKALLSVYGIPVPPGKIAVTPAEASRIAMDLGGKVVVKAQIYTGGRGKAGGIKTANNHDEAEKLTGELLDTRLVTHQTPPKGTPVRKVLIEKAITIQREMYLGIVIDGSIQMPVMIASSAGGMDIEEVARKNPEKIVKVTIDTVAGFQDFLGRKLAYGMGLSPEMVRPAVKLMSNLYRLFLAKDCTLAEINPLAVTKEGELIALDAKLNFDDSALFRHDDIRQYHDAEQVDPLEAIANELDIHSYVKLDGNIACMVNGAGLAMAVQDMISYVGGKAANFLDIGTINDPNRVVNSFQIFTTDPNVKAILLNIFGGITRADVIARGIIDAYSKMNIQIPVIVRLAGTNVTEGKRLLAESGINYIEATDLADAAHKAVAAAATG
ncbi:MAG: ADP-forming succinate--CoA ligase subunit beta [Dehalococcoidia bacterium]|nr:ADP-forming succinate--CoA ligase subunit beta [Dehalococcoidia bacterium]